MDVKLAGLDPSGRDVAQAFVAWLRASGWPVVVTSAVRSAAQQAALKAKNPSGLPVASPTTSRHVLRRAFDLGFQGYRWQEIPADYWRQMGEVWEYLGGRWGGRFGDPVHFDW